VSLYLDASILVPLVAPDSLAGQAEAFFGKIKTPLSVSDLAAAEVASAVSRKVRMREVPVPAAEEVLRTFDSWITAAATAIRITGADIAEASGYLRRLDLNLRTADAIHIAAARRLALTLATFDRNMAESARTLGVAVAEL